MMLNTYITFAISVLLSVCCCSMVVGDESSILETTPTTVRQSDTYSLNLSTVTDASHSGVPSTPSRETHGDSVTGALEPPSTLDEGSGNVGVSDSDSEFGTREFTTIQEYLTDEFLLPTSDKVYHSSSTSKPTTTTASTISQEVVSETHQSEVTTVTEPSGSIDRVDYPTRSTGLKGQSSEVTSPVPEYTTSPFEESSLPEISSPLASAAVLFTMTTTEPSVTSAVITTTEEYVSTSSTAVDTATTGTETPSHHLQVATADEGHVTASSTPTAEIHVQQQATHDWTSTPSLTTPEVPGFTETSTSEMPGFTETSTSEMPGFTETSTSEVPDLTETSTLESPGSTETLVPALTYFTETITTEVPVFTQTSTTEVPVITYTFTTEVPSFSEVSTEATMVASSTLSQLETSTMSSATTSPYVVDVATAAIEVSTITATRMSTSGSTLLTSTTSDTTTSSHVATITATTKVSHSTERTDSAMTTTEFPETVSDGLSVAVLINTSTEKTTLDGEETSITNTTNLSEDVTVTSPSTFEGSSDGSLFTETTELPIMKNVKSYDNLTEAEFFNSVTVIFRKPLENRDSDLIFFNQDVFKKVVTCLINAYEFDGWTSETINETVCDYENKDKQPSELSEDFQELKPNDLVIVYPSPKTSDDTELVSFFVKNSTSTAAGRIVARNHTLTALNRHRQFLADQMKMEVADIESRIPVQLLITSDGHRSFSSLLLVVLLASVLFCIMIIATGVVCIKWRSQSGQWHKTNHDKVPTQLQSNAMRSEAGAHHLNSDEDIRKDENQLVWRNGNGPLERGNSRNGNRYQNGGSGGDGETVIPITENEAWVVPLTPDEEKRVPETLDTKL